MPSALREGRLGSHCVQGMYRLALGHDHTHKEDEVGGDDNKDDPLWGLTSQSDCWCHPLGIRGPMQRPGSICGGRWNLKAAERRRGRARLHTPEG